MHDSALSLRAVAAEAIPLTTHSSGRPAARSAASASSSVVTTQTVPPLVGPCAGESAVSATVRTNSNEALPAATSNPFVTSVTATAAETAPSLPSLCAAAGATHSTSDADRHTAAVWTPVPSNAHASASERGRSRPLTRSSVPPVEGPRAGLMAPVSTGVDQKLNETPPSSLKSTPPFDDTRTATGPVAPIGDAGLMHCTEVRERNCASTTAASSPPNAQRRASKALNEPPRTTTGVPPATSPPCGASELTLSTVS